MASLKGSTIASSYKSLLKLNDNAGTLVAGNGSNAIQIVHSDDSTGVTSPLFLNTDRLGIGAQPEAPLHVNGSIFAGSSGYPVGYANVFNNFNSYIGLTLKRTGAGTSDFFRAVNSSDATKFSIGSDGGIFSAGSLGIGTATIQQLLHLEKDDADVGIALTQTGQRSWSFGIDNSDSDRLKIGYSTTIGTNTVATFTESGSVGIGTSSPQSLVDISASTNNDYPLIVRGDIDNDGGYTGIAFNYNGVNPNYEKAVIHVQGTSGNIDPEMHFLINSDGGTTNATIADAVLSLKQGGNIDANANYIVNEQGRQNHVANTMSSPYYRFDGVDDYISIADNDNIDPGTGDFSYEILIKADDYTSQWFFAKFVDGNNDIRFGTNGSDLLQFYAITGGVAEVDLSATVTGGLTDGEYAHIVVVADRSGSGQFYVNGSAITTTTTTMNTDETSNSGALTLGKRDSAYYASEISRFRQFNKALTSTEVKELYSGASVPFKYKGASQTNTLGSLDFTSSWSTSNASITDSDTFTVSADNGFIAKDFSAGDVGKRYRLRIAGTVSSGNLQVQNRNGSANILTGLSGTFDQTTEYTYEGDNDKPIILRLTSSGATADITHLSIVRIGAVAEYDGSGITANKWYDGSGNELHGTVSGASDENTASAPVLSDNHPAFCVHPTSSQDNIAINTTLDVVFGTERFDQGSNFASNTFTAPVTGKYQLNLFLRLNNMSQSADFYMLRIETSNDNYQVTFDPDFGQDTPYFTKSLSVLADMDINDTAKVVVFQSGGGAQTDIDVQTFFSGYLVC